MSDTAIKQRLNRARERAANNLRLSGHEVFSLRDKNYTLIAMKDNRVRLIRIELDKKYIINKLPIFSMATTCEIWLSRKGTEPFSIIDVNR